MEELVTRADFSIKSTHPPRQIHPIARLADEIEALAPEAQAGGFSVVNGRMLLLVELFLGPVSEEVLLTVASAPLSIRVTIITHDFAFESRQPILCWNRIRPQNRHLDSLRVKKDEVPAGRGSEVEGGLVVEDVR